MRGIGWVLAGAALGLAGCTATGGAGGVETSPGEAGVCDAARAQALVGQQATAEVGQRLLALTGARNLRWVAPGMAVTMDFRPDRLTVTYDETMRIERISCG
jgi:hypothetical protein